ncbi:MAG: acetate uptake transporter [Methanomicrobiales archaeon]
MPMFGGGEAFSKEGFIAFLAVVGLFSLVMFLITFGLSKALQIVFGRLTLRFILLIIGNPKGSKTVLHIAGGVGIPYGLSAMYTARAEIMNEDCKKKDCPSCVKASRHNSFFLYFPLFFLTLLIGQNIGDLRRSCFRIE